MIAYLKNVIAEFLELIKGKAATPATEHLLMVRDGKDARPFKDKRALAFHHTVAQLLFMATRTRRNIQMAVAFLNNWRKLKWVPKYLNGTKYPK